MDISINSSPTNVYAEVGRRSQIEGASPHKLIELLLTNAVKNLRIARESFDSGEVELRGKSLVKAAEIVTYLRLSLDLENGGEIAANLYGLYAYIERELVTVHADENVSAVDHVSAILTDLLDTWVELRDKL